MCSGRHGPPGAAVWRRIIIMKITNIMRSRSMIGSTDLEEDMVTSVKDTAAWTGAGLGFACVYDFSAAY